MKDVSEQVNQDTEEIQKINNVIKQCLTREFAEKIAESNIASSSEAQQLRPLVKMKSPEHNQAIPIIPFLTPLEDPKQ